MRGRRTDGLQTLLVGIDAGCFNVLDPLLESGDVPNLASVINDGISQTLESQIPPWTASAWPSLYTGANPGKHGVFGFLSFEGYDWDIVNASHVRELTLWEILDRRGLTSVVVNGPVTYPPPEIDGAVIPGYVAPEQPKCHPEGLFDELTDEIGEYRVYTPSLDESRSDDRKVSEYCDLVEMRGDAFRYLDDRFDPDFGFLQFQVTDTMLHEFPGDREKARRVYRAVDEQLGRVFEECDPDTVIVASDHGMDSFDQRFAVNEFLRENDYVEASQGGLGMPTWAGVRDNQLVDGEDPDGPEQSAVGAVMARLADHGITSQRVGAVLDRLGLADVAMAVVPDELIRAGSEQVDFADSTAYMRSRVECGIRINLAGREPDGVVDPDDYEAVRAELMALLSSVETPAGEAVFETVAPGEEYFSGPYADEGVDIITIPTDFRYYFTTWLTDDLYVTPDGPAWDHIRDGILAAAGEGIEPRATTNSPHLFDVAPTVLATLGVPVNARMDGSPLPFVDDPGETAYPYDATETSDVSDEQVEDRLSNLGYLE